MDPRAAPILSSLTTAPLIAWSRLGAVDRPPYPSGRRFVIVHLDGVSRDVLRHALESGAMPYLSQSIRSGERKLTPTFSGTPASTPAFQATLFYGERGDCPGYQWHDKARGVDVRMDDAAEVLRLEETLRRRSPGLLHGGNTYFSIIGGGATEPTFSMSRLAHGLPMGGHDDPEKNGWDHLASVVAHVVPFVRGTAKMAQTAVLGSLGSLRWSMRKGTFRNEPRYMLHRMLLAGLAEEVTTSLTALDICRGVPAIYSVYAGYDEVAHRRGPFSEEALAELAYADRSIALLDDVIRARPELRYEMYVLSDHGQEPTRPAEELLGGITFGDWLLAAEAGGRVDTSKLQRTVAERARRERLAHLPFGDHLADSRLLGGGGTERRPPLVIADAGDLAHVYFTDRPEPFDLEGLLSRWPIQLQAALTCPAAGIVATRGGRAGFAFHKGKRFDLAEPGVLRGILPYDPETLRQYLREMIAIPSSGDLLIFGAGVGGGDVAYAWEFGSHGGVGTGDVETFLLHPSSVDASALAGKGPLELHRFFHDRFIQEERNERAETV